MHELAHIRRFDAFTNILLVAIETILFYHPAVWWVGRRVRTEREHCCDDFAVSTCGDVTVYAEALTSVETWRASGLALGVSGGKLKQRVERLLGVPPEPRKFSLSAMAGLALLSLIVACASTEPLTPPLPVTPHAASAADYPPLAVKEKEQGTARVKFVVYEDGNVGNIEIVNSSGFRELDDASVAMVARWRYKPAFQAGKPVRSEQVAAVRWVLR
jgi:D-alanyl-D-alanine endopeptidase (penicillin-binding protein 7)